MKSGRTPAHRRRRGEAARPSGDRRGGADNPPGAKPSGAGAPRRADRNRAPRESDAERRSVQKLWIYGRHAALAAIANPNRKINRVLAAESALEWLAEARAPKGRLAGLVRAKSDDFERALHAGAVHQGLAVEVEPLARVRLRDVCQPDDAMRPVVVLDQITDPHNIGAIFRSAAAFGVRAVIVQDRRTPPLAGALAKAAAGAVECVPCVDVVNIARALEGLVDLGYLCVGLSGEAVTPLERIPRDRPIAMVLGAEGAGLRRLVAATCEHLVSIPIASRMESLNVSNAAAVALYEIARGLGPGR